MMPNEFAISDIDNIRIEREGGNVVVRVGIIITFYFDRTGDPAVRAGIGAALDHFLEPFTTRIRWHRSPDSNRYVAVDRPGGFDCQGTFEGRDRMLELDFGVHDAEGARDAPLVSAQTFCRFDAPIPQMGFLSLSLGLGDLVTFPGGAINTLVERLCTLARPLHGYAGLGIIRSPNPYAAREADAEAVTLAQRFAGLELDAPIRHLDSVANGIKGINWMTVVSDQIAARLNGTDALVAKAAAAGLGTIRYPGGAIYIAGPAPDFADLEAGGIPSEYRAASALLKPLRVPVKTVLYNPRLEGIDTTTFTAQWQARFD